VLAIPKCLGPLCLLLRRLSPPLSTAAQRTRHSSFYLAPTPPDLYPLFHYDRLRPSASYVVLVTFLFLPPLLSFSFLYEARLYFMTGRVLQLLACLSRMHIVSLPMRIYSASSVKVKSELRGSQQPPWLLGSLALARCLFTKLVLRDRGEALDV